MIGIIKDIKPLKTSRQTAGVSPETLATLRQTSAAWSSPLQDEQLDQIRRYLDSVIVYNRKANITADNDPAALTFRHAADGLAAVSPLKKILPAAPIILDLGSGAGFIGMVIKIAWPEARVTLMERLERKFRFLNLAVTELGLKGLRVSRAPAASDFGSFDAVIERALAPLPEALKLALPLVREGGVVAAYQTRSPDTNAPEFSRMLATVKAKHVDTIAYQLPEEGQERNLVLFERCTS